MGAVSETPSAILSTLRDVSGVIGSFVVSADGECIARDIAPMFTNDLLHDVGPRIMRLAQAFSVERSEVMSCLVRYREHTLLVRGFSRGSVCVISEANVNLPALKMGVTLSVRRLSSIPEFGAAPPAPPPSKSVAPAPSAARPSVALPTKAHPSIPVGASKPVGAGIQWRGGVVSKS